MENLALVVEENYFFASFFSKKYSAIKTIMKPIDSVNDRNCFKTAIAIRVASRGSTDARTEALVIPTILEPIKNRV